MLTKIGALLRAALHTCQSSGTTKQADKSELSASSQLGTGPPVAQYVVLKSYAGIYGICALPHTFIGARGTDTKGLGTSTYAAALQTLEKATAYIKECACSQPTIA